MDVIEFMWDLVANPEKLARYKQNPAAYLEQEGSVLSPGDRYLLLQFDPTRDDQAVQRQAISIQEVSTVTQVELHVGEEVDEGAVEGLAASIQPADPIYLDTQTVKYSSRAVTFLAEENASYNQLKQILIGGLPCRLLRHSYIRVNDADPANPHVSFNLHLCYISRNPYDTPTVLHISLEDPTGATSASGRRSLSDRQVILYALRPVVVVADHPTLLPLQPGSFYDRNSGQLVLITQQPPAPDLP